MLVFMLWVRYLKLRPLLYRGRIFTEGLNSLLPKDIKIKEVALTDLKFHPVHSATSKEYHYFFTNERPPSPFYFDTVSYFKGQLDFEKMKEASKIFLGTHNFNNFYCEGTPVKHYRRQIFECELKEVESLGLDLFWGRNK